MDDIHSRGHARLASIYHHLATKVPQAPAPEFNDSTDLAQVFDANTGELRWDLHSKMGHFYSLRVYQFSSGNVAFVAYANANFLSFDSEDEAAEQLEFLFSEDEAAEQLEFLFPAR